MEGGEAVRGFEVLSGARDGNKYEDRKYGADPNTSAI